MSRTTTNGGRRIIDDEEVPDEVAPYYPDEIIRGRRLGRGSFGDVFEVQQFKPQSKHNGKFDSEELDARQYYAGSGGQQQNGGSSRNTKYAVKCVREDFDKPHMFRVAAMDMQREVNILTTIDYPFIIKVYAKSAAATKASECTQAEAKNFFIVMDRLTGTLNDKIGLWKKQQKSNRVPLFKRGRKSAAAANPKAQALMTETLRMASEIAAALAYLHSERIIYRDLKPDNVGLDLEGKCKIFDFGLARRLPSASQKKRNDTYQMTGKSGSLILMAPEVFKGEPYNEKADVYSFAMLLWNMLALDLPYLDFIKKRAFETKVMGQGMRPDVQGTWPKHAQILLQRAWAQDYAKRPSMKEICSMLKEATTTPTGASAGASRGYVKRSSFM